MENSKLLLELVKAEYAFTEKKLTDLYFKGGIGLFFSLIFFIVVLKVAVEIPLIVLKSYYILLLIIGLALVLGMFCFIFPFLSKDYFRLDIEQLKFKGFEEYDSEEYRNNIIGYLIGYIDHNLSINEIKDKWVNRGFFCLYFVLAIIISSIIFFI